MAVGNSADGQCTDEDLRRLYSEGGLAACRQAFPHADPGTMARRASYLGFATDRTLIQWTREEDDILRQHYPALGAKGIEHLLPKGSREENQVLREEYQALGALELSRKLGRSAIAIRKHASDLGIPRFTDDLARQNNKGQCRVQTGEWLDPAGATHFNDVAVISGSAASGTEGTWRRRSLGDVRTAWHGEDQGKDQ